VTTTGANVAFLRAPYVSYPKLFVTRRYLPAFVKSCRVRYLGLGLVLGLGVSVSARG